MSEASSQVPQQRTILGHPTGLFVLFFTEMWERFSYYGMRALLVLYMVDYFKMTQEDASNVYKWYTSLVYLTPILGGFLADRYLGNKWAIIIGAILMSIGHFLMAFEDMWIFYSALGFLIMGNGFFKPNMSVQVGRLYPQNDPRRDGAYTIFYMGINLGAFLSPLVCGALRDTDGLGYHWGFGAAGVGMVIGLVTYVVGLPLIKELPANLVFKKPKGESESETKEDESEHVMTESEAESTPSAVPSFSKLSPSVFTMLGVIVMIGAPIAWATDTLSFDNMIACEFGAISLYFAAWILAQLSMAVRDRVLAIYALFMFVVFFWGAFEQAGNAMNVWADQTTNRYLTETPDTPEVYPGLFTDPAKEGYWTTAKNAIGKLGNFNPVLTTSFQSINALAIVCFAPLFAWLWLFLARRNVKLSIAGKMAIGVFLQGMAFALMIWATLYENGPSETELAQLPEGFEVRDGSVYFLDAPDLPADRKEFDEAWNPASAEGEEDAEPPEKMIAHGGRMNWQDGKLSINGVLDQNHRDRILRATASAAYVKAAQDFALKSQEDKKAAAEANKGGEEDGEEASFSTTWTVADVPDEFDPNYFRGYNPEEFKVTVDGETLTFADGSEAATGGTTVTFAVTEELADKDYKQLLVAGANPEFREALNQLYRDSAEYRVSSWWLFWFYILCTLGELCLSPVGLSMVSKLAPRRFATMLMGIWLLTSFFGNFAAGLAGENWEYLSPQSYFTYIAIVLIGASVVCFFLVKIINRMMHGVR